jgi:hypothetical protein
MIANDLKVVLSYTYAENAVCQALSGQNEPCPVVPLDRVKIGG